MSMPFHDSLAQFWPIIIEFLSHPAGVVGEGSALALLIGYLLQKRRVKVEESIKSYFAMVKKVHDYSMKYYFPMATAAAGFAGTLKVTTTEATETSDRLAFFWFGRFLALASRMMIEHMTYFLTDYEAENAAQALQTKIQALPNLTPEKSSALGKAITLEMRFADLSMLIDLRSSIAPMFEEFQGWLNNSRASDSGKKILEEARLLARSYTELLIHELNLMSRAWYGRKPNPIPIEKLSKIREIEPNYKRSRRYKLIRRLRRIIADP